MNDNNDNTTTTTPPISNVIDFKPKTQSSKWPAGSVNKDPEPTTKTSMNTERKLLIALEDDMDIEIEGFLGLHNSFLIVGDVDGNIKFAAAAGRWKFVTDVTFGASPTDDVTNKQESDVETEE